MHWNHEPRQLVGRGVLTAPRLGGVRTARPTLRFMESPLAISAVHRDHEPETRKPFGIKPSVFRFMESPLAISAVHRDHEPTCSAGSAGILPASRRIRVGRNRPAGRQRSQARFMESPLPLWRMHWDHELRNWSAGLQLGAIVTRQGLFAPD